MNEEKEFKMGEICTADWFFPLKQSGAKVMVRDVVTIYQPLEKHQEDAFSIHRALKKMKEKNKTMYNQIIKNESGVPRIHSITYKTGTGQLAKDME